MVEAACTETLPVAYATVADLLVANTNVTSITDCNLVQAITNVDVQTVTTGCNRYYTRTYTVTDACGHSSTIDQIINVTDVTAPVITGTMTPLNVNLVEPACTETLPVAYATVADLLVANTNVTSITDCNLVQAITNVDVQTVTTGCNRYYTRTYTVTDACGHSSTIDQIINVNDVLTAPVITGTMTPLNVNLVEPACTETLPVAYATVADLLVANTNVTSITDCNLVQAITNVDVQTVTTGCNRYYTRTYTVTDACGHSSTIDQIINVTDVTAPVITGTMTPLNVNLVEPACTATLPDGLRNRS